MIRIRGAEELAKGVTDDLFLEEPLAAEDQHDDDELMCCICRDIMNKDEAWGCE